MSSGSRITGFFERLIDPLAPAPVDRPPPRTRDFFIWFLHPIRWLLATTLAVTGISAVAEMSMFVFLGTLIDWMTVTPREEFLDRHGLALAGMIFVVAIIRPAALLVSRAIVLLALAPGITNTVRWRSHRYVLRQSLSYFQNDFAGRIAQKIMQTGNAVREAVINIIDGAWILVIYLIGAVFLFLDIDWRLLVPISVWIVGYIIVAWAMIPPVRDRAAALSEANSALTGRVVDSYTNIQTVKLFARPEREDEFAATAVQRHTTAFRALLGSILTMTAALTVLNTLLILTMAALSLYLWLQHSLSLGAIALANGLIIRLSQMSAWILRTITALFENIGTVQNGVQTISQPMAVIDAPDAAALTVSAGRIHFDRVDFRYSESISSNFGTGNAATATSASAAEKDTNERADLEGIAAIRDFSLVIEPGEKVGIVGRSGAGKSTLVNLLMRFYDINDGSIKIDGTDIAHVTQASLRASIAMVTQDTSLLHRSIADNISYGSEGVDQTAIDAAAQGAAANVFIPDLVDPNGRRGMQAYVGERGVKLSGGQRQRIAIARVILKNAPILVLDEATSALDSEVEAAIADNLDSLMRGKTVIAIAHRLSTIAALDRLVVMDEGRIVETGSHDELLEANGLYASLWQRQSGGFLHPGSA